MKIKLFNGQPTTLILTPLTGGHDTDTGVVTIIVKGEGDQAGMIQCSVIEAHKLGAMLMSGSKVEKVEPVVEPPKKG